VKKPEPAPGLVIRYDYLWRDEAERGRMEGSKDRPCAIVIARTGEGPAARVWLAPITHSPPSDPLAAVEIPTKVKAHLGLDAERSWIIIDELNGVAWSDPGIVPASRSRWDYGFLPPKLAQAVVDKVLEQQQSNKLRPVDRVQLEKRRARDEKRGR
jgi:hypothetical protein